MLLHNIPLITTVFTETASPEAVFSTLISLDLFLSDPVERNLVDYHQIITLLLKAVNVIDA